MLLSQIEEAYRESSDREELELFHPFEIHIVSEDGWRGWYGRFLKGEWREIDE